MTTQLHQMNVSYFPVEDRLLLKISSRNDDEYRLWLTRRYAQLLLKILDGEMDKSGGKHAVASNEKTRKMYKEGAFEKAYEEEKFQEAVDALKPILKKAPVPLGVTRLHLLALARLGEAPKALDAYEEMVKTSKREDEGLLRQMAIASILPRRTDMREQIRGAAYMALKEINSDEVIPYLEDGLTDGSGMLR